MMYGFELFLFVAVNIIIIAVSLVMMVMAIKEMDSILRNSATTREKILWGAGGVAFFAVFAILGTGAFFLIGEAMGWWASAPRRMTITIRSS